MTDSRKTQLVEELLSIMDLERDIAEILVDMFGEDVIEFAHQDANEELDV